MHARVDDALLEFERFAEKSTLTVHPHPAHPQSRLDNSGAAAMDEGRFAFCQPQIAPPNQQHNAGAFEFPQDVAERSHAVQKQLGMFNENNREIRPDVLLAAVQSAHDMIVIVDRSGLIEYVNPAFCHGTGYSSPEAIGRPISILKSNKHNTLFYQNLWRVVLSGCIWHGEITHRRKDGTEYLEEQSITPIRDRHGTVAQFIAIKRDVSDRKRAEETVRQSEEKHRKLFESSRDPLLIANADTGIIVDANPAAASLMRIPTERLIGMHQSELYPPGEGERYRLAFVTAVEAGQALVTDAEIQTSDGERIPVEISGSTFMLGTTRFIQGHFRDISERKKAQKDIESAQEETIIRLARAAEQRDNETGDHIQRMGDYCGWLAERAGLAPNCCEIIRLASVMHDVGKIGIPDRILLKPGPLTSHEFSIMKQHAEIGHRILLGSKVELFKTADAIAWTHHEKYDGSGYPRGLAGEAIPLEGRIAAIADAFDALTTKRVYKQAYPIQRAVAIMREGRGSHFDPVLLDLFLGNLDELAAIKNRCDAKATAGMLSFSAACMRLHTHLNRVASEMLPQRIAGIGNGRCAVPRSQAKMKCELCSTKTTKKDGAPPCRD